MTSEPIVIDVSGVSGEMQMQTDQVKQNKLLANLIQFPMQVPEEWIKQRRQNIRPWLQFIQTSNFRVPGSLPRLSRRIMRNIEYFQSNYLLVILGLSAYCLLTTPLLLLTVAAALFAGYKLSKRQISSAPVKIFGHELTIAQQHAALMACCLPIFYLAGAGAAAFWTIGASCVVISLHAAFYNIDALIAEPEESFNITQEV